MCHQKPPKPRGRKKGDRESQRQVARDEGISQRTVARILSQPALKAAVEYGQYALGDMMPEALTSMRHSLKKKNVQATVAYFNGLQVFISRQELTHDGPAEALLDRADVKGRTEQEIAYFIEHGHYPEDSVQ
jgi:hypothetical protein